MNRAKLLCLALKGAIGKKGAGIHSTGLFDLAGFGAQLQVEYAGLRGKVAMMAGVLSPGDLYNLAVDLVTKRKSPHLIPFEMARAGEAKILCRTAFSTQMYDHQGIAEDLEREAREYDDRSLASYHAEAREKGWEPLTAAAEDVLHRRRERAAAHQPRRQDALGLLAEPGSRRSAPT